MDFASDVSSTFFFVGQVCLRDFARIFILFFISVSKNFS